jgi:hypothetical protein
MKLPVSEFVAFYDKHANRLDFDGVFVNDEECFSICDGKLYSDNDDHVYPNDADIEVGGRLSVRFKDLFTLLNGGAL